jgi:hypothetical protein
MPYAPISILSGSDWMSPNYRVLSLGMLAEAIPPDLSVGSENGTRTLDCSGSQRPPHRFGVRTRIEVVD